MINLTNWTQYKKGNGRKICTKSVRNYGVMRLMLHTRSIPKPSGWVLKKIFCPLIYYRLGYSNNCSGMCLKELDRSSLIV